MNIDILLALLRDSAAKSVNVFSLAEETCLSIDVVKENLIGFLNKGLVQFIDGGYVTSGEQRLELALLALGEGADVERVCKSLGWKEFEDLVAIAFEFNGFKTTKHFRFKGSGKRYEIDVVGLKEPLVFSVECKRWKRSWVRGAMVNVVRRQMERTEALIHFLPEPKDRLDLARWREVRIIPLVLTLSKTPLKLCDGVPIVPIFFFNNFLNEVQSYIEVITSFTLAKTSRIA